MVEIGGHPILWHIMKGYAHFGYTEFVILLGYKGFLIKKFFADYFLARSDVTIDLEANKTEVISSNVEPWKVTLLDTGEFTMTGGRIKQAERYLSNEPFLLTYGDGVSDVNCKELVKFHKNHGKTITMTSIQSEGRFGVVKTDRKNQITSFREKIKDDTNWINGGFFVCEPDVFSYLPDDDSCIFEEHPLRKLVTDGEMFTYKHKGFWQCMDTVSDHKKLTALWDSQRAPWKVW